MDQQYTLEAVPPGRRAIVRQVMGGPGIHARLLQMGIVPGEIIEIISNNSAGPIVIRVRGALISLGRGVARKILVSIL